jgi:hypothetical protein
MLVLKRFDICLRIMVHLSMAGFSLARIRSRMNLRTLLLRCSGKYGIYVSCDETKKLTNNDRVMLNFVRETIVDSHGGKFH